MGNETEEFLAKWGMIDKTKTLDELIDLATNQNDVNAQKDLAERYFHGVAGAKKNYKKAMAWSIAAAENGDIENQGYLGNYYFTKHKYEEAYMWYSKLLEINDSNALTRIGYMYYKGKGVEKDIAKAIDLFTRACEEDIYAVDAYIYLGDIYYKGIGVEKDIEKALDLYDTASDFGGSYEAYLRLMKAQEEGHQIYNRK